MFFGLYIYMIATWSYWIIIAFFAKCQAYHYETEINTDSTRYWQTCKITSGGSYGLLESLDMKDYYILIMIIKYFIDTM